jgi:hypothetical protein
MSSYDLTGSDPTFLKTDVRFKVFEANQVLDFNEAVYPSSIIVTWLNAPGGPIALTQNTDWNFGSSDRDYKAMSEARLIDEDFNTVLIKSIRSLAIVSDPGRTYAVAYQRLKLSPIDENLGSVGPEPTRGLMKDMVEKIDFLMNVSNPLGESTSISVDSVKILDEDLTATNPDNNIIDEVHTVNVPAGRQIIRVAAGSFFAKDLVIKNAANVTLTKGIDYELVGTNMGKTKVAQDPSGVWDYIFLLTSIVGDLRVSYRAFGGQVTQKDINNIRDVLADVVKLIHIGGYITAEALPSTLTIVSILQRMAELEDFVSHYKAINHRFRPATTGKHWFTIAKLHLDRWNRPLSQGHGHLTIVSGNFGWSYDFTIAMNFSRSDERVRIKVLSSLDKTNEFALGDYPNLADRNIPEIRVIWQGSILDTNFSGAIIQVGYNMEADVVQDLGVRNVGGSVSDLFVFPNTAAIENVVDNNVALPNGETWTNEDEVRLLLAPEEGYLAWAGSLPMTMLTETPTEFDHVIGDADLDLSSIGVVKFFFYDRVEDRMIISSSEHAWDDREDLNRSVIFFGEDLCAIGYKIYRDSGEIKLSLTGSVGTNSTTNARFDLRQIVFYT